MHTLTRLWDAEYNLLYSSDIDERTVEQFMADHGATEFNCTVDRSGVRWGGKVRRNPGTGALEYRNHSEYLKYLTTWPTLGVVEQYIPPALAAARASGRMTPDDIVAMFADHTISYDVLTHGHRTVVTARHLPTGATETVDGVDTPQTTLRVLARQQLLARTPTLKQG